MNKLHHNIRALRDSKGWNQDTMAKLLKMSPKAYSRLEQGKTDIQLSRLEQIAQVLEVEIARLFDHDETAILKLSIQTSHHSQTSNGNQSIHFSNAATHLEHELEKARLIIEQKDKEIDYLKEIIALLKKTNSLK